jgi:hypothetical protein
MVSLDTVPDDYEGSIRGLPMLYKMPFDFLAAYARGGATAPTVTAVSPRFGSAKGGDTVTVTGSRFTDATRVSFGTAVASNLAVASDTELTVTSPPAAAGPVDVTVTTPAGTSAATPADQFTYS